MTKKVSFKAKPKAREEIKNIESWIKDGSTDIISALTAKAETIRFTIDIPVELHATIKYKCAIKKVKMKEEIQTLLENHFL
jgi:hypothetical protein